MALNGGLAMMMDWFEGIREQQRMFDSFKDPLGLREQQRMFDSFKDPLGLREQQRMLDSFKDPLGLRETMEVHRYAAEKLGLIHHANGLLEAMSVHKALFAASDLAKIADGLDDILGAKFARQVMSPYVKLDRALDGILPKGFREPWQEHFAKSTAPTLALLATEWTRPVGILASMADSKFGASLSWLRESESPTPAVAALIPTTAPLPEVTFDVTVTCAFCDDAMIEKEITLRWKGNRKGALDVSIVPICPTCTKRSIEDPDYAMNAWRRLNAPRLRVVKTNGTTDGVRRGKLRLVKNDDDKDM